MLFALTVSGSISSLTERERHARAEDGLRAHTRSASREGLGGAAHDRKCLAEAPRRAAPDRSVLELLFAQRARVRVRFQDLISTSELQRSQPYLAMISGLRVAQSSR